MKLSLAELAQPSLPFDLAVGRRCFQVIGTELYVSWASGLPVQAKMAQCCRNGQHERRSLTVLLLIRRMYRTLGGEHEQAKIH